MADFNENELNQMRRDALRRMQELQKRAQGTPPPVQQPHTPRQTRPAQTDLGSIISRIAKPSQQSGGGGLFNIAGIAIDEEKAMIAMLIYILYKQGSDVKLLLALGYLLL